MCVEIPLIIASPLSGHPKNVGDSTLAKSFHSVSRYGMPSKIASTTSTTSHGSSRYSSDNFHSNFTTESINFDFKPFRKPSETSSSSFFNESDLASLYSTISLATPIAPPKMSIRARKAASRSSIKSQSFENSIGHLEKSMSSRYSLDEHTPKTHNRVSMDSHTSSDINIDLLDDLEPFYASTKIGLKSSKTILPKLDFSSLLFGQDVGSCDMDDILPGSSLLTVKTKSRHAQSEKVACNVI